MPDESTMELMKPLADNIRLNMTIVSDTHLDVKHPMPALPQERFRNVLRDDKASLCPVDALEITGDTTSRGMHHNWELFFACFSEETKGYAKNLLLQFGNHDTWHDDSFDQAEIEFRAAVNKFTGIQLTQNYYAKSINGYTMIMLGSQCDGGCDANINDDQIEWLDEQLKQGTANGLPAFVFNHQAINGMHGLPKTWDAEEDPNADPMDGGIGASSDKVKAVLEKYKNVYYFSGHSHMGLCGAQTQKNGGWSSFEVKNGVTYVMTPSLACGNHHGEDNSFDIGFQLEVYDKRVVIRPRSFSMQEWCDVIITDGKPYFEAPIV